MFVDICVRRLPVNVFVPRSRSLSIMVETSGHYGTLRLLSKSGKAVQTFPVDSDVLTFGRDQSCDVRMYFTFVSPLHAKLVFEDGKVSHVLPGSKCRLKAYCRSVGTPQCDG